MLPERVGVPRSMIVLGKHSGRHALEARYRELGYTLTRGQLETAYVKFLELADQKKRVEDQDLISIHESSHSVAAG
jgi:2-isopropylmalate synthase